MLPRTIKISVILDDGTLFQMSEILARLDGALSAAMEPECESFGHSKWDLNGAAERAT